MFGDREIHRKLSGAGGYAAGRLAEISDSLGQLAKIMKNSGEDPGLSREDGIAALEAGIDLDCASIDLHDAWRYLGEITGQTLSEQIIDRIFEKFCLGK